MLKGINKQDKLIILIITLIFLIVDFLGLGNTSSPETFADFGSVVAEIEFTGDAKPDHMMCFTGIKTGTYSIEFSSDGINYIHIADLEQNYGEILRWKLLYCYCPLENVNYARIWATGDSPRMGEVVFFDSEGNIISYTSNVSEICDEQDKVVEKYSYMNSTYFDEIYHVRTALEYINGIWPYEISHPPLGKLIIALGISIFGITPFGWRFSGTFFGVLMIPAMYVFLKKMFKSTRVASCISIIFATDFLHFVQTRIATIDTYSVFFIILMYLFMYMFITEDDTKYLFLSGLFFGLGAASKWTSIYAGAGLAVIWLIYHIKHRDVFIRNALLSIVYFVIIPGIIYYLSYIPYGIAQNVTNIFSKDYFKIVWSNQEFMFSYHANLVAEHPYSSKWYQWIFNIRPILYYLEYYDNGTRSSFGAFMNPVLCWGGLAAMVMLVFEAVKSKDKNAGFIVIGYLAQLIPWIFVTRITFEYHYFPCCVFLALALGYIFEKLKDEKIFIYGFTAISAGLFIYFYPVLSGLPVSSTTNLYHWMQTWPF